MPPPCSHFLTVEARIMDASLKGQELTEGERISKLFRYATFVETWYKNNEEGEPVSIEEFEGSPTMPFILRLPMWKVDHSINTRIPEMEWAYMVCSGFWIDMLARVGLENIPKHVLATVHKNDRVAIANRENPGEKFGSGIAIIVMLMLDLVCFPIRSLQGNDLNVNPKLLAAYQEVIRTLQEPEVARMTLVELVGAIGIKYDIMRKYFFTYRNAALGRFEPEAYIHEANEHIKRSNEKMMLGGILSGLVHTHVTVPRRVKQ